MSRTSINPTILYIAPKSTSAAIPSQTQKGSTKKRKNSLNPLNKQ
jgi:hypothetical protein